MISLRLIAVLSSLLVATVGTLSLGRTDAMKTGADLSPGADSGGVERIAPDHVTLSNLELFKAQVQKDLPPGTPRRDVEAYLARWDVPAFFAEPGPMGNAFYLTINNIGKRLMFEASLAIRIFLNDDGEVDHIVFRVDYL